MRGVAELPRANRRARDAAERQESDHVRRARAVRDGRAAAVSHRPLIGTRAGGEVQRRLRGASQAASLEPAVSEQPALQKHQVAMALARDAPNHRVEV